MRDPSLNSNLSEHDGDLAHEIIFTSTSENPIQSLLPADYLSPDVREPTANNKVTREVKDATKNQRNLHESQTRYIKEVWEFELSMNVSKSSVWRGWSLVALHSSIDIYRLIFWPSETLMYREKPPIISTKRIWRSEKKISKGESWLSLFELRIIGWIAALLTCMKELFPGLFLLCLGLKSRF